MVGTQKVVERPLTSALRRRDTEPLRTKTEMSKSDNLSALLDERKEVGPNLGHGRDLGPSLRLWVFPEEGLVLLEILRDWWRVERPGHWLFPGDKPDRRITTNSVALACRQVHRICKIPKPITPHSLRHYSASPTITR